MDELCGEFGVVGVVQLEQFCKANGWSLVKGRIREDNNRVWKYRIDNISGIKCEVIENVLTNQCAVQDNQWYSGEELITITSTSNVTSALIMLQNQDIQMSKGKPRINGKQITAYKKA